MWYSIDSGYKASAFLQFSHLREFQDRCWSLQPVERLLRISLEKSREAEPARKNQTRNVKGKLQGWTIKFIEYYELNLQYCCDELFWGGPLLSQALQKLQKNNNSNLNQALMGKTKLNSEIYWISLYIHTRNEPNKERITPTVG